MDSEEASGTIAVRFCRPACHDAELLVKTLVLGLKGISDSYGAGYITLDFKEV